MSPLFSPLLERALRFAADRHRSQHRKATTIPYITHPVQVAWILQRAGYDDEHLLAAALLHDVIEDCGVTRAELEREFSPRIAELVAALSERKLDASGHPRPWEDRKREHLTELTRATPDVLALTLADKLHNLETIAADLRAGVEVWSRFNAPRERSLWYYAAVLDVSVRAEDDPCLHRLRAAGRDAWQRVADGN